MQMDTTISQISNTTLKGFFARILNPSPAYWGTAFLLLAAWIFRPMLLSEAFTIVSDKNTGSGTDFILLAFQLILKTIFLSLMRGSV